MSNQLLLSGEQEINTETEGIKYIGSKKGIIPYILQVARMLDVTTILDGFSGTTRVAQAFSKNGYNVISNDIAEWSKVFGECYLLNSEPYYYYQDKIDYLNSLPGKKGWFSEHYGGCPNNGKSVQKDGKKKIWQMHNTMKLDTIREKIDEIAENKIEKSVLLTSLIIALDKVDNTVGHQVSYLKKWAPRSYKTMQLKVPKIWEVNTINEVHRRNIFSIIREKKCDLAYFDPPYGSANEKMPPSRVRYASYYHLWKTICLNDKPKLFGAANRREDSRDIESSSIFEDFQRNENGIFKVVNAIGKLIQNTNSEYIVLSYSNQGRATKDQIVEFIKDLNLSFDVIKIDYKSNVMALMRWTNEWIKEDSFENGTIEYLFLISRNGAPLPGKLNIS